MIWLLSVLFAQEPTPEEAIQKAFEREFAYVFTEKNALEEQKKSLLVKSQTQIQAEEKELLVLEKELAAKKLKFEQLSALYESLEKKRVEKEERESSFSNMLTQAETELGITEPSKEATERVDTIFRTVREEITLGRTIQQKEDDIFLSDGTKVQGTIFKIGEVLAFGKVNERYGALLPLGKGDLQLNEEIGSATSQKLFAGEKQLTGNVYLAEGFNRKATIQEEKTALEVLEAGGFVAWIIVFLGGFGALIGLVRAILLLLSPISKLNEEKELSRLQEGKGSSVSFFSDLWERKVQSRDQLLEVAEAGLIGIESKANRFSAVIPVIAAVAPLLGLLGTVSGMISTFEIITEHGTGDPRMLSTGISEALITTQLGLMVAIPMLLLGNGLKSWSKSLMVRVERLMLNIVASRADLSS